MPLERQNRNEAQKAYIYALICPLVGKVRYVGKTIGVKTRFYSHINNNRRDYNYCKRKWMEGVLNSNAYPVLSILEECNENNWSNSEKHWIQYLKKTGHPLLNITEGGESYSYWQGKTRSQETKDKMSKAHIGLNTWAKGSKLSEEHKKKISKSNKGKKKPPRTKEHTENFRQSVLKYRFTQKLLQNFINENMTSKEVSNVMNCSQSLATLRLREFKNGI